MSRPPSPLPNALASLVVPGLTRPGGRLADQLRPVKFTPGVAPHATGSVLVSFGSTQVICAVTIEDQVPRWMKDQGVRGGWLTAEYSMLPYATLERKARDITKGKADGRSIEIQRLIGRSLRAAVDLEALGQRTVWIDCDVLQADGGTRTASITGATVALGLAFRKLMAEGRLKKNPLRQLVAAISVGIVENEARLDLEYVEDKDAAVDANFVLTESLSFVEIQVSGEEATFTDAEHAALLALAKKGVSELVVAQRKAISE